MDIISQGIQSYQTNQTHAGWAEQNDITDVHDSSPTQNTDILEDRVSLSSSKAVYDWIAQEFPPERQQTEDIVRLNQQLFDYQLFKLEDVETVNRLMEQEGTATLDERLDAAFAQSTSYQERRSLGHIRQVYATLDASRQAAA